MWNRLASTSNVKNTYYYYYYYLEERDRSFWKRFNCSNVVHMEWVWIRFVHTVFADKYYRKMRTWPLKWVHKNKTKNKRTSITLTKRTLATCFIHTSPSSHSGCTYGCLLLGVFLLLQYVLLEQAGYSRTELGFFVWVPNVGINILVSSQNKPS